MLFTTWSIYDSYVERRVPTARKLLKRHIASVTLLRIAPSGSFKFFSLSFLAKKIESTHYIYCRHFPGSLGGGLRNSSLERSVEHKRQAAFNGRGWGTWKGSHFCIIVGDIPLSTFKNFPSILTGVSSAIKPSAQQRKFLDRVLDSSSVRSSPYYSRDKLLFLRQSHQIWRKSFNLHDVLQPSR